jgi:Tol biopolymer transport system component
MNSRPIEIAGALAALCALTTGALPGLAAESASPAAPPAPICAHGAPPAWVTDASHPNDGIPDPAGRIVFGQYTRDDVNGQLVSLFAVDPDGSDLVQLLDCDVVRPRFSPDGRTLAFGIAMDDGSRQVATMDADGSDLRILTSTLGVAETPDWSPDGSWLIYAHAPMACFHDECLQEGGEGFHMSLWRMGVDGSDQRRIDGPNRLDDATLDLPVATQDWEPRLSPDGTKVVYLRIDGLDSQFTVMLRDLASGAEQPVTGNLRGEEHADWSRDGRWIIYNTFTRQPGFLFEQVERVPADDPMAEPVVVYPADASHGGWKPTYSPDGSRIAFTCEGRLCAMDADGSNVATIAVAPGREINHVAWGVSATDGD